MIDAEIAKGLGDFVNAQTELNDKIAKNLSLLAAKIAEMEATLKKLEVLYESDKQN